MRKYEKKNSFYILLDNIKRLLSNNRQEGDLIFVNLIRFIELGSKKIILFYCLIFID